MADESQIMRGLIGIDVDDGDAVERIRRLIDEIQAEMQRVGQIQGGSAGEDITKNFVQAGDSVDQMLRKVGQLSTVLADVPGVKTLLRDLDMAAAKLEQLGGRGYAPRHTEPSVAAMQAQAVAAVAASKPLGGTAGETRNQGALEASEKRLATEQQQLATAIEARTVIERGIAAQERVVAAAQARRDQAEADFLRIGSGKNIGQTAGAQKDLDKEQAQLGALLTLREVANREIALSEQQIAKETGSQQVLQQRITEGKEREAAAAQRAATTAQRKVQAEERAAAQEAAKQAAQQAARADPRQALLAAPSEEYTRQLGADPAASLKAQSLQLERAKLQRDLEILQNKAGEAKNTDELEKILAQRTAVERRILANSQAQIAEAGKGEGGGRSGFFQGLMGSFYGNQGGEGGGFGNLLFQAGQATKFYALYSTLSLVQRAIGETITQAEQLTVAINDLAIATGTSNDEAEKQAVLYSQIGRTFASSPIEATEGATKFIRSFRTDEESQAGLSRQDVGGIGARVTSLIQQLEGKQDVVKVTQDLIGLTKAFGLGAASAEQVYDQVTKVAQAGFGFKTGGEVLSGVAAVGDIGKESGFDVPRLTALIASVMQRTGVGADAAAGDVKRFLGSQDTLDAVFERYNISADDKFAQRLDKLGEILSTKTEAERAAVINTLGGARIGAAVSAAIQTLPAQKAAAGEAEGSTGTAAEQATRRMLETFGGAIDKLRADADALFGAIVTSGLGDLGTHVARVLSDVVRGLTDLLHVLEIIPGPAREIAVAAAAIFAAGRLIAGIQTALAGSQAAAGLAAIFQGGAGGTTASVALQQLQVQRGTALAAANMAQVAALDAQIAATTAASAASVGLTTRLTGMAAAIGRAALAMAPILAALAAIVAYGEAASAANALEEAASRAVTASKGAGTSIGKGQADTAQEQLDALKKAREDLAKEDVGTGILFGTNSAASYLANDPNFRFASMINPLGGPINLAAGQIQGGEEGNRDLYDQRKRALEAIDADIKAKQAQIDALNAAEIKLGDYSDVQDFFGRQFDQIPQGARRIIERRIGAEAALSKLEQLIPELTADSMTALITPPAGSPGAADIFGYTTQRIGRLTDPQAQQDQFRKQREVAQQLLEASSGAPASEQAAAQEILDQANKSYTDVLVKNTQAKIETIKAANPKGGEGPLAQIRALVGEALGEAAATGDVSAVIDLLGGVDQAFLTAFKANLNAQVTILQQQAQALQAALSAAAQTQAIMEAGDPRQLTADQSAALIEGGGQVAANTAAQERIRKQLETLQKAQGFAPLSGKDFDFGAGKGPDPEQIELARIQAEAQPGNQVQQAAVAVRAARYQLKTAKDPLEYYQALKELRQAQYDLAQAERGQSIAALAANEVPGDQLSQARTAVRSAQIQLSGTIRGTTDYYQALKGLRQAQYDLARAEMENANQRELLGIDITDPVAQAQARVREAQRTLAFDAGRGADTTSDQVALRQARADAERAAFDQTFQDQQTNYELNRISLSQYQSYLQSQHDYLSAVGNKTRQQVDELNQVDRALKSLADQMQGQFNLGDIKIPTPYEMRRAVAAGGMGAQGVSTTYVDVSINGADLQAVRGILTDILGTPVTQTVGTSVQKVG